MSVYGLRLYPKTKDGQKRLERDGIGNFDVKEIKVNGQQLVYIEQLRKKPLVFPQPDEVMPNYRTVVVCGYRVDLGDFFNWAIGPKVRVPHEDEKTGLEIELRKRAEGRERI